MLRESYALYEAEGLVREPYRRIRVRGSHLMQYNRNIHIGKAIKAKFEEQKANGEITKKEFANRLNCSYQNLYHIFNSQDIYVSQLVKISTILNFNFLSLYQNDKITEQNKTEIKMALIIKDGNIIISKLKD
ncbi:MAG: hypothetical protein LBR17_05595 [Bacteroidales bacterium]|nr:hypothetical protein [Bacteroidales bacterium]